MSTGRRIFWIVLFAAIAVIAGRWAVHLHLSLSHQDDISIAQGPTVTHTESADVEQVIRIWDLFGGKKKDLALLLDVIAVIFGSLAVFVAYRTMSNITAEGDVKGIGQEGGGDIHIEGYAQIDISPEEYEADLKRREQEITEKLKQAAAEDRRILEIGLAEIERRLADTRANYRTYIRELKERTTELDAVRGQVPGTLLDRARDALAQGDLGRADSSFAEIEAQAKEVTRVAAEAAYQRSEIARDEVRYRDAYAHAQRVVQMAPKEVRYLSGAGQLAQILGDYQVAKDYHEQALAIDIETLGEDHPHIATHRNNLGSAWHELGEYEKAIGYYEQALASDLETYGEDHFKVVTHYHNLGGAWDALGEYEKAIGYFEQALASDLKTLGKNHPHVALLRSNLGSARLKLGEHEKAIDYLEQALTVFEPKLGSEHQYTREARENLAAARAKQDATAAGEQ